MINLGSLGVGHVLASVGGLAVIGYIGQGVMEEMGWRRSAVAWNIVIYVSGTLVVVKYFMEGLRQAMAIISAY